MEELDEVPPFIEEDKYVSAGGVFVEIIKHKTAETIKAFSHIAVSVVKEIVVSGSKDKHQPRRIRDPIVAISMEESLILTPLGYVISRVPVDVLKDGAAAMGINRE